MAAVFIMLTSAFIRHEIDAINEKRREIQKGSERKGEGLAIFYRLHIHPDVSPSRIERLRFYNSFRPNSHRPVTIVR